MARSMASLTKIGIVESIYKKCGLKKTIAVKLIDSLLEEINVFLENNATLKMSKLGNFSVKHKKARCGRNPKTKQAAIISERKVVVFRAHKTLIKQINDNLLK